MVQLDPVVQYHLLAQLVLQGQQALMVQLVLDLLEVLLHLEILAVQWHPEDQCHPGRLPVLEYQTHLLDQADQWHQECHLCLEYQAILLVQHFQAVQELLSFQCLLQGQQVQLDP